MTDNKWTFPELEYVRPDVDAVKEKIAALTEKVRRAESFDVILAVLKEKEELAGGLYSTFTIAMVRHTIDTSDEFYEKENAFLNQAAPTLAPYEIAFSDALLESPYKKDIEEKYGKQYFTDIELRKKAFCEENIPLQQEEALLCDEYQKIIASCEINYDGKKLNLYGIQKYFESTDPVIRAEAWKKYSEFYEKNERRFEEIWDALIKNRNAQGRNLGYENYLPLGYMNQGRTDYGPEEVESFRKQVEEYLVPVCSKLYEAQAKRLGSSIMMAYDEKMVFPDGNAEPAGDDDFMMGKAREMYHEMSPETGEFIDFMMDHQLLDLKNKPKKASTGYMTALPDLKAPFVFSCFNHTIFDMQVLSHELGHAFAGYEAMRHQPIMEYYEESTDIAEIHSMSMEQFAYPYAEKFFGDQAEKYRFQHLQEALTFVPFGTAVDEFQHICYSKPGLTPKERTYEWHKLEQKYMPWRHYENDPFMERGGYWYHKIHIFLYPMYYINYCLTTMGAMEFKKKAAEDHENAWKDYLNLCQVGGSRSYLETLAFANVSNPFKEGTVEKACSYAAEILLKQCAEIG
ncbi:MAG: M3 family oligoendopeptidase [Lachnospiraceae bacterium]|nr:M3 family oligoendopeptidase [Lachnospiraceae bacterium]